MRPGARAPSSGPSGRGERRALLLLAVGAAAGLVLAATGLAQRDEAAGHPGAADVVAEVNGTPIARRAYERTLRGLAGDLERPLDGADRRRVLERMVDEELLVQRALDLGIARHDRGVRAGLLSALLAMILAEEPEVGEDELRALLAAEPERFTRAPRLRVRQIFVRAGESGDDRAARARALEAGRRLRAGEPFVAVRARVGDAEPVPLPEAALAPETLREYVGPTAARAARALAVGEVSVPVRSHMGFHVLELLERRVADAPRFEDVAGEVRAEWLRRADDRRLVAYVAALRAAADVRVRLPEP